MIRLSKNIEDTGEMTIRWDGGSPHIVMKQCDIATTLGVQRSATFFRKPGPFRCN